MVKEARLEATESGLTPTTEGWFVVNVRDARWFDHDVFGASCEFESLDAEFTELGIRICVLLSGQPNGLYHGEETQEDFLVLAGECLLLVEGEERRLRAWDFFHAAPGTKHIFVGSGEGPCVILMTGTRRPGRPIFYPVSELALRHKAGVQTETPSPKEAYASYPQERVERPAFWDKLPWA
ncbi:MAG: cupin domain-containing protein [Gaiellaceae bacterium]